MCRIKLSICVVLKCIVLVMHSLAVASRLNFHKRSRSDLCSKLPAMHSVGESVKCNVNIIKVGCEMLDLYSSGAQVVQRNPEKA